MLNVSMAHIAQPRSRLTLCGDEKNILCAFVFPSKFICPSFQSYFCSVSLLVSYFMCNTLYLSLKLQKM